MDWRGRVFLVNDWVKQVSGYLTGLVPERLAEMQAMEAYAEGHR